MNFVPGVTTMAESLKASTLFEEYSSLPPQIGSAIHLGSSNAHMTAYETDAYGEENVLVDGTLNESLVNQVNVDFNDNRLYPTKYDCFRAAGSICFSASQ